MNWADELRGTLQPVYADPTHEKLTSEELNTMLMDMVTRLGEAQGRARAMAVKRAFDGINDPAFMIDHGSDL